MERLEGKTAVITGAASGIGLAMAHRFGAAGMNLVLGDLDADPLDAAVDQLTEAGSEVAAMRLDVSDLDAVREFESFAREQYGPVHLLCNNAGVGSGGPVQDPDDIDMWKWVIDIDLWGVIYGCKVFLTGMIEHGEGAHVVNTASMAGLAAAPLMGPYTISKYGVVALSETMSKEMQMFGHPVGVSVLCPGFVRTGIANSRRLLPDELRSEATDSSDSPTASMFQQLVDGGIETSVVADAVHDAVVGDEFWILTHPEAHDAVAERARQIADGVNPTPQPMPTGD